MFSHRTVVPYKQYESRPSGRSWVRVTSKNNLREQVIKDTIRLKLVVSWKTNTEILAMNTLKVMSIIFWQQKYKYLILYTPTELQPGKKKSTNDSTVAPEKFSTCGNSRHCHTNLNTPPPQPDPVAALWPILGYKVNSINYKILCGKMEHYCSRYIEVWLLWKEKKKQNVSWQTIQTSEKATIGTNKPVLTKETFFFSLICD